MNDFLIRIKALYTVNAFHVTGSGFFEFHDAIVSISPVFPFGALFLHHIRHPRRGHVIRFSYAEVYQFCAWVCLKCCRLCPLNLLKLVRSEEHTSELQSRLHLVCRLLLEKKKKNL